VSTYFVARITICDPAAYERYLEGFDPAFEGHGGEVLVVDDQPVLLEGSWPCTRTVLIRFPNLAAARAWYDSPAYQSLARIRHGAASADIVLVEGSD
jgi:uncharacterized protein (DUF1330 family)